MSDTWKKLLKSARRRPLFVPGTGTTDLNLGRAEIELMIPHRPPFLLVDAITAVDVEQTAVSGRRFIDPEDPVFAGHFPGDPVYPGVLQVEAMCQLSLCLHHLISHGGKLNREAGPPALRLLRIGHALFMGEVRPGDEVTLIGKMIEDTGYTQTCAAQLLKGDTICAITIAEVIGVDAPQ